MNKRNNGFTLVELLVVICIASLLMGVVIPAFSRMVTGSAVDRLASNLKLRLEQAQSHAASSRRHVALILPHGDTDHDWNTDRRVKSAALGGSRMCYVDDVKIEGTPEVYSCTFMRWIPDEDWITPERGALLIAVSAFDPVDSDGKLDVTNFIAHNAVLTGNVLNGTGKNAPLKKTNGIKFIETSDIETDVDNSAIIFSPKGGVRSTADVYLVIAEAMINNDNVIYPGGQINNFRVLRINRLTGKVEYHR